MSRPVEPVMHIQSMMQHKMKELWGFYGQIGAGKTTLAASISKFFPDELPTEAVAPGSAPLYELNDVGFCSFDPASVISLNGLGISVPNFDIQLFMSEPDLYGPEGFKRPPSPWKAAEIGIKRLIAHGVENLIIDDVSAFDEMVVRHYFNEMADEKDNRKIYNAIGNQHSNFYDFCVKTPTRVIFLFQAKAEVESDDATQAARQETQTSVDKGIIGPHVTGRARGVYKRPLSMLGVVTTKLVDKNGVKKRERQVLLRNAKKYETKCRYPALADREVAHLRKMKEKISG